MNYTVVQQHVDEAAMLYALRTAILTRASIGLRELERVDNRLRAHIDGISVAGDEGWRLCEAALEVPSAGTLFTATVRAIQGGAQSRLDHLFALTRVSRSTTGGLLSAFEWLERQDLRGIVANLLADQNPSRRLFGVAACASHRVDPGSGLASWIQDRSSQIRTLAARTAGEVGRHDLVTICATAMADEDPVFRSWAGWSAVLLGNRGAALEILADMIRITGSNHFEAFCLVLQAMTASGAHGVLQDIARDTQRSRWLIQGSGIVGDTTYIPWLIDHMRDDKTARVAGEAFSLITGADLSAISLDRPQPEDFESGPTDNPDDPNVDMDPDEGLPWPDPDKIEKWWAANAPKFQKGTRYFMGAPVTREHCIEVLKNGYQRQRILAAHYLCLLDPGTPLFNTSAPAWRQQRLLAKM